MSELQKAAMLRVRQAVDAKPTDRVTYCRVRSGDVALLAALVPQPDDVVRAIGKGCSAAAADHGAEREVWTGTEHLRHLLSLLPA